MKRNRFAALTLAFMTTLSSVCFAAPESTATPSATDERKESFPVLHAESAIVIDLKSGDIIYALDADKKVYPAGITNLMTAVLALENKNLADNVTVTKDALASVTYDQPQLGIEEGENYTVQQLLYAIILNSNNDASNALAIAVSGSIDAFVQKMNEKAAELGMTGTSFANPSGNHNENHYTTASDTAKLAEYAMKNQTIAEIVTTQKYTFPPTNMRTSEKTILSTNHLVSRYKYPYHFYPNATGIKSGNSKEAGYCLAASAVKNGFTVLSVIMGAPNADAKDKAYSFVDTKAIFDYVFENYQSILLAKKGDVLHDSKVAESKNAARLALTVEEDLYTTLKKTADPEIIENTVELTEDAKAPIEQGQVFGTITFSYNNRELKKVNLVAANEVKRDFMIHLINSLLGFIFHPIVIGIILIVFFIWARLRIVRNRKRRLRHSRMVSQGRRASVPTKTTYDRTTPGSNYRRRR